MLLMEGLIIFLISQLVSTTECTDRNLPSALDCKRSMHTYFLNEPKRGTCHEKSKYLYLQWL